MKFISLTDDMFDDLEEDFHSAMNGGKVRSGNQCLFFPHLTTTHYLPYRAIAHAFIRQEDVPSRLCCGKAHFDQIYLVTIDCTGTERQTTVDSVDIGKTLLQVIAEKNPIIKIGYYNTK